ncbi:MAG TPA: hypothetical protein VHN74_15040 [Candidatus Angelobacter sp.]|nr:hypothetical protein [Candidatus Angelobacter sp.]
MRRTGLLRLLEGGDRRSTGQSDRVVSMIRQDPSLFAELISGLWSENALVRMRSADAAEKASRDDSKLLAPYANELLGLMCETQDKELRWHLAVIAPRVATTASRRKLAWENLRAYLDDTSSIVRTFALQGMADVATSDATFRPEVIELLEDARRSGSAAMKARSRKLLKQLSRLDSRQ